MRVDTFCREIYRQKYNLERVCPFKMESETARKSNFHITADRNQPPELFILRKALILQTIIYGRLQFL